MKEQLKQRIKELETEFETGQKMLAEMEAKRSNLKESLLRISGAIQVLKEELEKAEQLAGNNETKLAKKQKEKN